MNRISIALATALLVANSTLTISALAAPDGNFKLEIQTKFPWPIAASISDDRITLKSKGRTTIHGATRTISASGTKIVGEANFSTNSCNSQSKVKVTLKFTKDGKLKSGSAKGRCSRTEGQSRNFSGSIAHK